MDALEQHLPKLLDQRDCGVTVCHRPDHLDCDGLVQSAGSSINVKRFELEVVLEHQAVVPFPNPLELHLGKVKYYPVHPRRRDRNFVDHVPLAGRCLTV